MKRKAAPIAMVALLVSALFFPTPAGADALAPAWKIGNRWEYSSSSEQHYSGTTSYDYYSNQTSNYNVTGTETIDVGGNLYDVFIVENRIAGSSDTYGTGFLTHCDYWYNYTYFQAMANYSIVKYVYYCDSTSVSFYSPNATHVTRIWQYAEGEYSPPFNAYDYPVNVGERWNASSQVHSTGHTKSRYDNQSEIDTPFDTWSPVSCEYRCDCTLQVNVPAGNFGAHKINQTTATPNSTTYTYSYYSEDAGNMVKMTVDQLGSQGGYYWTSSTVQELVSFEYASAAEFHVFIIPLMVIVALFLAHRKSRARSVEANN